MEFAIVCVLLFTILFGIIQFGFLFYQWLEIEHAAREGARWGSLGKSSGDITSKTIGAAAGIDLTSGDVSIAFPHGAVQGAPVVVEVRYDTPVLPLLAPLFGGDGAGTYEIRASATQRIE